MAGSVASVKFLGDLQADLVDLIAAVKVGKSDPFALIPELVKLVAEGQELLVDGEAALPELSSLDAEAALAIGAAAYQLVLAVVAAAKK